MIVALEYGLLVAAGLLVAMVLVLLVEVLAASTFRPPASAAGRQGRICVLVPAHDEGLVIRGTLAAIGPELNDDDRLLIVADNCTDDTAAIARTAGAEVIERTDPTRVGKSYALDWGIRHIAADPPDVVVVVDADCHVVPGALDRIAGRAHATGCPVQALYLMNAPTGGDAKTRAAAFAMIIKNHVRPLGLHRLGLPCQLMGTGMAFPWSVLPSIDFASGQIVEDMKLGLDLARQGHPPRFCPEALVTGEFPTDEAAAKTQRTRWEHGHLGIIVTELPGMLWHAVRRPDLNSLVMVLDLAVPPLALLALLIAAGITITGLSAVAGWASAVPLYVSLAAAGGLMGVVLAAWLGWGRRILSPLDLAALPLYVAGKVPIYLLFWVRRQTEWIRTSRR